MCDSLDPHTRGDADRQLTDLLVRVSADDLDPGRACHRVARASTCQLSAVIGGGSDSRFPCLQ